MEQGMIFQKERAGGAKSRIGHGRMLLAVALLAACLLLLANYFQPRWLLRLLAQGNPSAVYYVDTGARVVALTIDDAPHSSVTPAILDVLRRHGANATFFMLGSQVPGNEVLLSRVRAEGHEIGNHSMTRFPSILLSPSRLENSLLHAEELLGMTCTPKYFRPGSGWYSGTMLELLARHGYKCILGSVYPHDTKIRSETAIRTYVLRRVFPGSIIVLHDGNQDRMRTAKVLEFILPRLKEQGYRVVTVTGLLAAAKADSAS